MHHRFWRWNKVSRKLMLLSLCLYFDFEHLTYGISRLKHLVFSQEIEDD